MIMTDRGRNRGMKAVVDFSMVLSNRGRLKPRISSSAGRRRSRHGQGDLATVGVVVAHADLVVAVNANESDDSKLLETGIETLQSRGSHSVVAAVVERPFFCC